MKSHYYLFFFNFDNRNARPDSGSFTADAGLTAYGDAQAAACDA